MNSTTQNLLNFVALHSDVYVRRIDENGIWLAGPAVQLNDSLACACSELSPVLATLAELKNWLGY